MGGFQQIPQQQQQQFSGRLPRISKRQQLPVMSMQPGNVLPPANGFTGPQSNMMNPQKQMQMGGTAPNIFTKKQKQQFQQQQQQNMMGQNMMSQNMMGQNVGGPPAQKLCTVFLQTGDCQYGVNCRFLHQATRPDMHTPNQMGMDNRSRKQFACNKCGSVFDSHGVFKSHIQVIRHRLKLIRWLLFC